MVWFYQQVKYEMYSNTPSFQSHYGLILSTSTRKLDFFIVILSIPLWSDFISLYVLLNKDQKTTFNPTMVWFYHFFRRFLKIKIVFLSIPLWSDFILIDVPAVPLSSKALSIPLWSDFISSLTVRSWAVATTLSIPLWSDFILRAKREIELAEKTFNPTMVWFYRTAISGIASQVISFQSHYGLILSLYRR